MSTLYADPSDDFSLPKRAQVRDETETDPNGYVHCYDDLFILITPRQQRHQPGQHEDEGDETEELDFSGMMMPPSLGYDDDPL